MMTEFDAGGVYIMPQRANSKELEGIFFVRSGLFKNAVFRFNLVLDSNYPQQKNAPVITLNTNVPVSHPLIHPQTLVFDSSSAFPVWNEDHIYELLKFFKYSFENMDYSCAVNHPSNHAAVDLYNKDREQFSENAKETVTRTINEVFASNEVASASNKNFIFSYDKSINEENLHDQILENMKNFSDSSIENFSFSFDRRG